MAHQSQLESRKYRNLVKAGLGLKYTKEGLEPFCDHLVKQQHADILNKVKQKHNLVTVQCGLCDIKTLQPDHVRTKSRQCPLGQVNCNCQHPSGKSACPNKVCGAIYDEIIQLHASTPPAPFWKNTDVQHWCTKPWAIGKCFINTTGYDTKSKASEFDCSALLHVLLNNLDFLQNHLQCAITGTDLFSKVVKYRNDIFHSPNMELEDGDVTRYIDDMIAVLEDGKYLVNRQESKAAVQKLRELKSEDFIISTIDESEVRKSAIETINEKEKELAQKLSDTIDTLGTKADEHKSQIERLGADIKSNLALDRIEIKNDFEQTGQEVKADLVQTGTNLKNVIERNVKKSVTEEANKRKHELEQTGQEVKDALQQTGMSLKNDIESHIKKIMAEETVSGIHKLDQTGKEVKDDLHQTGIKLKDYIELGVKKTIGEETGERKEELEQTARQFENTLAVTGLKLKNELYQQVEDAKSTITEEATRRKYEFKQKGKIAEQELKQRIKNIERFPERQTENINRMGELGPLRPIQNPDEYANWKAGFQKKLVAGYMKYAIKVSTLPLLPEKHQTEIVDVYEPPWMSIETESKEGSQGTKDISMNELFRDQDNKPAKNIYVLGEAGSGKSALCKMLMYYWCHAHSERADNTPEPDIVREMAKFEFLFYVALRHYPNYNTIESMLNEIHRGPSLEPLLENESDKCLILLDGLDEWTAHTQNQAEFQTQGLPTRDMFAGYTVITTSRDWKFETLRINDSEVDKKIKLKGISGIAIQDFSENTVKILNKHFKKNKVADNFELCLENSPVEDIIHIPMLLQQLICLWFDDRLKETSKCAVYSSMLDIFFEWKAIKNQEGILSSKRMLDTRLPEYLSAYTACCDNKNTIYHLSHLAFETLFKRNKENSLAFSNSIFQNLNISDDVKTCALKAGILTEDQSACLFASMRQPSSFSFVHKSMQEYLAAVYIAIQYDESTENEKWFVRKYFENCTSGNDILEQSNVFIMLSGLEPHLLPCMSEYIYQITTEDIEMLRERKLQEYISFVPCLRPLLHWQIQICIENCIKEVLSRGIEFRNSVYIAYIAYIPTSKMTSFLERHLFKLQSVFAVDINMAIFDSVQEIDSYNFLNHLIECNGLKAIKCINLGGRVMKTTRIEEQIMKIVSKNTSTLETVSLFGDNVQLLQLLIPCLSDMHHLTSLEIRNADLKVKISHKSCETLTSFLEQTSHLQQIYLHVECDMCNEYTIDLNKHNQLQYLNAESTCFSVTSFNADNLETYHITIKNIAIFAQVCECLKKACKLKTFILSGCNLRFAEVRIATEKLTRLLPSLTSLSTVQISQFAFTDNIIAHPSNMRNLKTIELCIVIMNIRTWCKFIDSLSALPQTVQVIASGVTIKETISIPNERYMYYLDRHNVCSEDEVAAARQYVREKPKLFRVTTDNIYNFEFVTKKS